MEQLEPGDAAVVRPTLPQPVPTTVPVQEGTPGSVAHEGAHGHPPIPDHELLRRIGGGSYGEVWLARSILGTFRAVKIVYRHTFGDDRPFEREFTGIQKFEPISRLHESQVAILHVGRSEDYFYYVMELADDAGPEPAIAPAPASVPEYPAKSQIHQPAAPLIPSSYIPRTLKLELERRRRLPVPECIEIGLGLTTALAHLHKHGLVHRDVKPSNVIFVNGVAKLADIGLVTDVDATVSFVGTEGFLPPEGPGSAQADLFALGKVLYELSTGKGRKDYPEPPTLLGEFADRQELIEFGEIVKKACAPDTHERYATAEQMQADLLLLKTGKSVRQTRMLERRVKLLTRTAIGLLIVMVLGVVPYAWALLEARRARQAEAQSREQLRSSYLAQAKAWRLSHEPGSRAEALKVLKAAAEIQPGVELRNEAIANLARLDLHVTKVWSLGQEPILGFDAAYERYVFGMTNGFLSIRRTEDDYEIMRLPGYRQVSEGIRFARFSPDGRFLVTSSGKGFDQNLWDLQAHCVITQFDEVDLGAVAFSADSRRVALSFRQKNEKKLPRYGIWLYDLVENGITAMLPQDVIATQMRFHPRKNLLATCGPESKEAKVVDLTSETVVHRFSHRDAVYDLDWDLNGDRLATACLDGRVRIWELESPQAPKQTLVGGAGVFVSFSFDGAFLASGGWDGTMRIWDPATNQQLFKVPTLGFALGFSRPGYKLFHRVTENEFAVLELIPSRECRLLEPPQSEAHIFDFSFDSKWLLTADADGVHIWDLTSGTVVAFLPGEGFLGVVFGPGDDECLIATSAGIQQFSLTRDTNGGFIGFGSAQLVSPLVTRELVLSRDHSTLVFPIQDEVHILTLTNGQQKTVLRADNPWTVSALSRRGELSVGWEVPTNLWTMRVFDYTTTNLIRELPQRGDGCGVFSPDDRWLLVGDLFQYCLWDTATWQARYTLPKAPSAAGGSAVDFSPDGRMAVVHLDRETASLIETTSGRELAKLDAPEPHVINAFKFSPDGTRLAVHSGSIQLWDLRLIRQELAAMNLDWDLPPYPPVSQRGAK